MEYSLNISEVFTLASKFRKAILLVPRSELPWNSSMAISQFPKGCCGDTSQTLATYLYSELNLVCNYVLGSNNDLGTHAWLEHNGIVIDITADQFNDRGFDSPRVHVGNKLNLHQRFDTTVSEDGRHTSLSDSGSLSGAYACILKYLHFIDNIE
jgi:hypothetical protein